MAGLSHFFRLILLAAFAVSAPAMADDRVDEFLRGFDEMALWHDNRDPVPVRKWNQNLRVRVTGPMSSNYDELVMGHLNKIAGLAKLRVERSAPGATDENLLIVFDESSYYVVNGRRAGCVAETRYSANGVIAKATLTINLNMGSELRQCIIHELMHAIGFPGHPHGINTVLSYVYKSETLTEIDQMSLRVLYDSRIQSSMLHLPALMAARQIIAEQLGLIQPKGDASAYGKKHFENALRYLNESAENGNLFALRQLGSAYFFGQYVARDEAAGVAWWRRGADADDPNSQFLMGLAADNSRDLPRNPEDAVTWYRRAADRGQPNALNELAVHYRDGAGTARDPVSAYVLFRLAEKYGVEGAGKNRAALIATMSPEQITEGERRVAAWKPK